MPDNIAAALELVSMALASDKESTCDLLLGSAKRLDNTLDIHHYKIQWVNQWIKTNENRKGAIYND